MLTLCFQVSLVGEDKNLFTKLTACCLNSLAWLNFLVSVSLFHLSRNPPRFLLACYNLVTFEFSPFQNLNFSL